jgi:SAM-dependent methyltransferase
MATNVNLTDMETCYKAMSGTIARSLRLTSRRFGIEPELTARLAQVKARIYEVPISYYGRTYDEGKKIGAMDGLAALWHIIKFNYLDREPIDHTMSQTLFALSDNSAKLYYPQLKRAIADAGLEKRRDLRILEIGSGIGTITQYLLKHGHVTATDIDTHYVDYLRLRFAFCEQFNAEHWDASKPPRPEITAHRYDLIIAFNVLEHIQDDEQTLNLWKSLLTENGVLVVLVPWGQRLFNVLDKALGHYRRYTPGTLVSAFRNSGLYPVSLFRDNPFGIVGWYLNGTLLKRDVLPSGQVSLYSKLKPLFWPIETLLKKFVGLNLVIVARMAERNR